MPQIRSSFLTIDCSVLLKFNATGRLREPADGLKGNVTMGINIATRPRTPALPLPCVIEL